MNYYYYIDSDEIIFRIKAKRKPGINTRTRSGTWVVEEFLGDFWDIPSFPEITLGTLNKYKYIGKSVI